MKAFFKKTAIIAAAAATLCLPVSAETVLRVGHFPNISHAQALVAHRLSMLGKGWFEERLGKDVKIQWMLFNAGPSAMESIFAGAVDITYVGPNPAINAFAKTRGRDIRILAGAADGGASLVVNPKLGLKEPKDLRQKHRNPAARQYTGRCMPRVAHRQRCESHAHIGRSAGDSHSES